MLPILFHIGSFPIPTYGITALLATLVCAVMVWRYARKDRLDPRRMVDGVLLICFVAILGARLLEIIVKWDQIVDDPARLRVTLTSGGIYLGGVVSAICFGAWWFWRTGVPTLVGLDILSMVGALSNGVSRVGCFASGCCYGRPTDVAWAVTFPDLARKLHAGLPEGPVHPTQLYMAFTSLLIVGILMLVHRHRRFPGQVGAIFMMLYGSTRFVLEFYRGDRERGFVLGGLMSTSQLISLLVIAGGIAFYVWWKRLGERAAGPETASPRRATVHR